ncbi:MAG: Acryloyl-CoA reductase electron transfer subunit gamma [Syntrophorhabdus sp. PtaU1.Bin058]|nr:MAG: Acryloyl-CoA reductase electron transfer subunit gamma [Syntrophorhabdus sp. PtaU1.Bin058]
MEIIVLVKEVLDPDLPPSKFSVDTKNNRVIPPEGIPPVISPYDAVAIEAALRIKEEAGGRITVVSLGNPSAEAVVRKALAMGADAGIVVSDPSFDLEDSYLAAHILTQTIRKIGKYDLILCGRQAVDWDRGVTGPIMAEYLAVPVATLARAIKVSDRSVRVERVLADGHETLEMDLPAIITVSNEFGQARIPSAWGVIKAVKEEIPVWSAKDIGAEDAQNKDNPGEGRLRRLYIPSYERKCEFLTGERPEELAAALVKKIYSRETASP